MVSQVIWSVRALLTYENEVDYLENKFSDKEIFNFTAKIERKILLLRSNPRLGRKITKKSGLYRTVINKRIILYYQYKPLKREIELVAFWNMLQHLKRLKL